MNQTSNRLTIETITASQQHLNYTSHAKMPPRPSKASPYHVDHEPRINHPPLPNENSPAKIWNQSGFRIVQLGDERFPSCFSFDKSAIKMGLLGFCCGPMGWIGLCVLCVGVCYGGGVLRRRLCGSD